MKIDPECFLDFFKESLFKRTSLQGFWPAYLQPCSKNVFKKTSKNAIFGHFWKIRIKLLVCRREALFSVPLRKESHFFPKSILCRQSETSQRNLTPFFENLDFFGLFWIFLKNHFLTHLSSLTKKCSETIWRKTEIFFQ